MAKKIEIMETVLRDAHQCLVATRMRTEDMLPIAAQLDDVGFWSLETWGGATFDATLRFLKQCPWERLRKLRAAMPKTRFQMLLRGQNIVGYRNYPDDVVQAFVERAAANGIDVFRIFDAMNDIRNMKTAIEAALKTGKLVEGTVCYTISPVHSSDYFLALAEKLAAMGVQIICLKDMGGMLAPYAAYEIVKKIKSRIPLPVHVHSHCTAGLAPMSYMMAIEAGADIIDTAISPFSQGTSQPATEQFVAALKDTPYDTGLDLGKLSKIAEYFYKVRRNYAEFESPVNNQIKTDVLVSQIPGGMLSNLVAQLRQQNAEDKLEAVLAEMPQVRKELGYPPLVTPTSQIVGSQAALNVMTGKRYSVVAMETRNYVMGLYGEPPGPVSEEIKKKVLGKKEPIKCRPADLLKPGLEQARKESAGLATSEEDVLSYALFPEIARDFFLWRDGKASTQRAAGIRP
ncbi:MAG TPA: pyruvate carboxylase subunit B [Candidatus Binatia bacterium]|jgi:pyruvate/oxaloacetate carboxyltransferase|nr:pyruvate carboxylase subunit B [Candidatus Binatia bacterium]